jgi:hypothetical protein
MCGRDPPPATPERSGCAAATRPGKIFIPRISGPSVHRSVVAVRRRELIPEGNALGATFRNTPPPSSLASYVHANRRKVGMRMVMPAVEEIVLEVVHDEDLLRLRVGQKIIARATLEDRALVKLSDVGRSYARRHDMRFLDVTRN